MIVSMKRMTLVALRSDEDEIMRELQKLQAAEVITTEPDASEIGLNSELFARYDEILKALNSAANRLKPYAKKPGLLTPLPEVEEKALTDEKIRKRAMDITEKAERLSNGISETASAMAKKEQLIEQLLPWTSLSVPVEQLKSTKNTRMLCGFVTSATVDFFCQNSVAADYLAQNGSLIPCIIYVHKGDEDTLKLIGDSDFSEYTFPKIKGTVQENIKRLQSEKADLEKKMQSQTAELEKLGESRQEVLLAIDAVNVEYDRLKSMSEVLKSKSAFLLEAWVRSDQTDSIEKAVQSITDAYYMQICDPAEDDNPPTVVKDNKFEQPFETIVNMYSRPAYNGIDATPFMTPFYMLFFGMMLGDSGYGLLLFLGTIIYEKLKKPTGGMKGILGVLKWSGLTAVLCGILFGTFFGVDFDAIFGTKNVFPLILDPMENVMQMLFLSCGLGLLHMLFALGIKIYMCLRDGDVQSAIYDNLSWILLIVGIIGAALLKEPYKMAFIITAILGAVIIVIFGGRNKKGVMKLFGGVASLYNITSWLSDTVSYARIFAIGLVGGAMGNVFNMIGSMIAGGSGFLHIILLIVAALVLVALHAFSLFINTLSAYAHTARLQYVEFFGKFYEPGGREFKPLSVNTKNVRIKNVN